MAAPPGWDLQHTLRAHIGPIGRLAWSPDGKQLATPGLDGFLIVWDAPRGKAIRLVRHEGRVTCAVFSPDGRRVASGFEDATGINESALRLPLDGNDDEPLPKEIDELLGDYEISTE